MTALPEGLLGQRERPGRRITLIAAATAALAALAAACGGGAQHPAAFTASTLAATPSTSAPATAPSPSIKARFLADVAVSNAALATFSKALSALPSPPLASQLAAIASPYADALQTLDNQLLRLGATGQTATDMRAMAQADGKVIGDLNSAGAQTVFSSADYVQAFLADEGASASADSAVRADLGLPPASPAG